MPNYKKVHSKGFTIQIIPTGIRELFTFLPYYDGIEIELFLQIKPTRKSVAKLISESGLDCYWQLCSDKLDDKNKNDEKFTLKQLLGINNLQRRIKLPYIYKVGYYELRVTIKNNENMILDNELLCDFELHSKDRRFINIVVPVLSAILTAILIGLIQYILHILGV